MRVAARVLCVVVMMSISCAAVTAEETQKIEKIDENQTSEAVDLQEVVVTAPRSQQPLNQLQRTRLSALIWWAQKILVRHDGAGYQRMKVPSGKLLVYPGSYPDSGTGRPSYRSSGDRCKL